MTLNYHSLNKRQRQEFHLKNDFVSENVRGKKILLVDDAVSYGSAIKSCSLILKRKGASSVVATVFLRLPSVIGLENKIGTLLLDNQEELERIILNPENPIVNKLITQLPRLPSHLRKKVLGRLSFWKRIKVYCSLIFK